MFWFIERATARATVSGGAFIGESSHWASNCRKAAFAPIALPIPPAQKRWPIFLNRPCRRKTKRANLAPGSDVVAGSSGHARFAGSMVLRYGMDKELGHVAYEREPSPRIPRCSRPRRQYYAYRNRMRRHDRGGFVSCSLAAVSPGRLLGLFMIYLVFAGYARDLLCAAYKLTLALAPTA